MKPDANQLHPDVNTVESPPDFQNYLDEFLQAIRVFGFLEKPVFHELARHLQTRRLVAGDSMSLDQDKSFYCVVDGMVEVFAQTDKVPEEAQSSWEHEDMNGYQLLNEVGSGGTLSSLFTILSLFTEDIKISWQEEAKQDLRTVLEDGLSISLRNRVSMWDSDVTPLDLGSGPSSARSHSRQSTASDRTSTAHGVLSPGHRYLSPTQFNQPEDFDYSMPSTSRTTSSGHRTVHPTQISRGVVARAKEDTTLAVIPAEAFRKLTKKFPKAAGHIVQVIITRFSRVTFNAAHRYLGLTSEVLRAEKAINDIACHPLPASFYEGGGLHQLRQKFQTRGSTTGDEEEDYFSRPPESFTSLRTTDSGRKSTRRMNPETPGVFGTATLSASTSRQQVQAGDLHIPTAQQPYENHRPLTRTYSIMNTPRVSRPGSEHHDIFGETDYSSDSASGDEFDLRDEVMASIAKSIGLLQPPLDGDTTSLEASPAFTPSMTPASVTPSEGRRGSMHNSFRSSFSSLSMLDTGDDASSVAGSSMISGHGMVGLDNEVEILFYPAGSQLVKAGEMNTGLFYVIEGFLDINLPPPAPIDEQGDPGTHKHKPSSKRSKSKSKRKQDPREPTKHLFTVKAGGIAGYLASLCSSASYVDIHAKTDTYVGFLPSHALERLMEKRPIVLLTLAKRLISMLSPLVLHIDASLDWMHVNAGQVLWRPDDESDSFYIVINGRLRSITEQEDGKVTITGEFGQGATVGELDVITSAPRRNTLHAIRDTELIRMPLTLFNAISARNPGTTAQLLRTIAARVRREVDTRPTLTKSNRAGMLEMGRNNANLKTVAVLPVSRNVPIVAFAKKLHLALDAQGVKTSYLNQASISAHLGRLAFSRMGKLKSAGWLADQEQRYDTVLYVADSPVGSPWTQTCIRQADFVLLVGLGDDPSIGEYERLLVSMKTTARKELVLLHADRSIYPGSTKEWLKNRPWVNQHIHIEVPGLVASIPKHVSTAKGSDAVSALQNLKSRVQNEIQKYRGVGANLRPRRHDNANDFARLARRLCGRSVGLVLGGGGARGLSHLGVIRALEEYGVPIDHVGGTSIGSFIGGLYAKEGDILSSSGRAKKFSGRMGNIWRMLSDVTYPIVAYTTGHEFNRAIYKAFYDTHIEDMWLPFFCNTTNILTSRMDIHDTGYAWRFIRASMTLVGLLPPLNDNGNILVDGGYVDNLPVEAMFSTGATVVFAVDVGAIDDNSPRQFGDTISGWWLLINRWNPFSNARNIPAITEIQARLTYVSSVKTLEAAKTANGCIYMAMPVQEYGTMSFGKFEEIEKVGYHAALEMLEKLSKEGKLPLPFPGKSSGSQRKKGIGARRNSI